MEDEGDNVDGDECPDEEFGWDPGKRAIEVVYPDADQ